MTNKFEQLIEFVINDEEAKAKELFHDIVVEKSREIYENLMNEEEEELDEESDAERDDHAEKAGKKVAKDIEYDELHEEEDEEELDESEEDLMNDVEAEEQGMQEEESDAEFDDSAEEDGEELTHDIEADHDGEGDIEDRVVDLEDKLDELMAEFEALMGGEEDGIESDLGGEEGEELGGDAFAQDDTEAFADSQMMEENVQLSKVAPAKMGDDGANTKSPVTFNSGAKGMAASPVKTTGAEAQGRPAPKAGELIGKVQNSVGGDKKLSAAPKPVTTQASGVNTKSPVGKA
jgi:hypothetical protein